jgi:hypothetical protein
VPEPKKRPSRRSLSCTLASIAFALAYDAVALLPLWAMHVPLRWAAAVQDGSRPLLVLLALTSLATLWWGLYGVYGAGVVRSRAREEAWLLWGSLAVVLALLFAPTLLARLG